jgi:hypothetical protein
MARRPKVKPFPFFTASGENPVNCLPERVGPIAVRRIVGSVSKAHRLTPNFLPLEEKARSRRFRSVQQAMQRGVTLPPIEVYALRREYYVIDGHNRVAAAIANGVHYLDAKILECIVPERRPEDCLANAQMRFERKTGLGRIVCSQPVCYERLLAEILAYRDRLKHDDSHITTREAARRWYVEEFVPVAEPLDMGATTLAFQGRTVSDLYLAVEEHRHYLEEATRRPVSSAEAVADFQKRHPRPLTARVLRPLQRRARRAVWRVTGGQPT